MFSQVFVCPQGVGYHRSFLEGRVLGAGYPGGRASRGVWYLGVYPTPLPLQGVEATSAVGMHPTGTRCR